MRTSHVAAAAAAFLMVLAACKGREAPEPQAATPPRPAMLTGVPTVGASLLTDTTGSPEADRKSFIVQLAMDSVQRFYRTRLPADGWHIIGDQGDTTKLDLYLRRDSLALWVHAERLGELATTYTLIASKAQRQDSTAR